MIRDKLLIMLSVKNGLLLLLVIRSALYLLLRSALGLYGSNFSSSHQVDFPFGSLWAPVCYNIDSSPTEALTFFSVFLKTLGFLCLRRRHTSVNNHHPTNTHIHIHFSSWETRLQTGNNKLTDSSRSAGNRSSTHWGSWLQGTSRTTSPAKSIAETLNTKNHFNTNPQNIQPASNNCPRHLECCHLLNSLCAAVKLARLIPPHWNKSSSQFNGTLWAPRVSMLTVTQTARALLGFSKKHLIQDSLLG